MLCVLWFASFFKPIENFGAYPVNIGFSFKKQVFSVRGKGGSDASLSFEEPTEVYGFSPRSLALTETDKELRMSTRRIDSVGIKDEEAFVRSYAGMAS